MSSIRIRSAATSRQSLSCQDQRRQAAADQEQQPGTIYWRFPGLDKLRRIEQAVGAELLDFSPEDTGLPINALAGDFCRLPDLLFFVPAVQRQTLTLFLAKLDAGLRQVDFDPDTLTHQVFAAQETEKWLRGRHA